MKKKRIYLWTGDGWGKTTSAIGAAVRACGHGKNVIIIQFMKGRETGEVKIAKKIGYEIYQFGRKGWVNLKNPSEKDKILARKGLELAKEITRKKKPFLIILDEINLACKIGLLDTKEVINFLDQAPSNVNIYLTGRKAPLRLMWHADYINKVSSVRGPKKLVGEKGIDY